MYKLIAIVISLPILAHESVPALQKLAKEKAALVLYDELSKPQSHFDRLCILKKWDKKSGQLFKPNANNRSETILECLEKLKGVNLKLVHSFNGDYVKAITSEQIITFSSNYNWCRGSKPTYKKIKLWDMKDLKSAKVLAEKECKYKDERGKVLISSDETLAVINYSDCYQVWNIKDQKILHEIDDNASYWPFQTITFDNNYLIDLRTTGSMVIGRLDGSQNNRLLREYKHLFFKVIPDSTKVLVLLESTKEKYDRYSNKKIRIYDQISADVVYETSLGKYGSFGVAPDGKSAFFAEGEDLCILDLTTYKKKIITSDTDEFNLIEPTLDNKVITANKKHILKVFDLRKKTTLLFSESVCPNDEKILLLKTNADNSKVLTYSSDGWFKVWDIISGKLQSSKNLKQEGIPYHELIRDGGTVLGYDNYPLINKNMVATPYRLYSLHSDWQDIITQMHKPKLNIFQHIKNKFKKRSKATINTLKKLLLFKKTTSKYANFAQHRLFSIKEHAPFLGLLLVQDKLSKEINKKLNKATC